MIRKNKLHNKKQTVKKQTVLLALSGGVDSTVAALVLKKQGYNVIGAFMRCFPGEKRQFTSECTQTSDKLMAQKVASLLGIPLIILNFEKQYKKNLVSQRHAIKQKEKNLNLSFMELKILGDLKNL